MPGTPNPSPTRPVTCGVLVSDGTRLLIGHATRTTRWDIPKGLADPGETHLAAACRELREETGLTAEPAELLPLGLHRYLPAKDLALFGWRRAIMPEPSALRCASLVVLPGGGSFPELDQFAVLPIAEALTRLNRNMVQALNDVLGSWLLGMRIA